MCSGQHPYEVDLLNEYDSTLHFVESQVVGLIEIVMNKIETWESLEVRVSCTIMKRDHLGKMIQQHELEKKKFAIFEWELREQCQQQQAMAQILQSVWESLEKLNSSQIDSPKVVLYVMGGQEDITNGGSIPEALGFDVYTTSLQTRVSDLKHQNNSSPYKPPKLGHLSGQDPAVKDEVLYEHWSYEVQSNRSLCSKIY